MSTLNKLVAWIGHANVSRRGRDQGNLASDQSGAIMIAGVFMAALLAAGVFYIIGTGDTIVYRERVQDASDAVAYTSAGVHARGMNLIVMINLIMVALMAILVAIKMLIVMIGIVMAACAVASILSFGTLAAICAPIEEYGAVLEEDLNTAANYYQDFLNIALPILSTTEKVVAIATPFVALAKSVSVAGHYKPLVTSGFSVSPSMIPLLPDGKKLGLPVKEMDFDKYCKKSAELGAKWALFWAPSWLQKGVGMFAGWVAGTFSSFFCGGSGEGGGSTNIKDTTFNDLSDMVTNTCNKGKDACFDDPTKNSSSYCTDLGNGKAEFNTALCKSEGKKKLQDSLDKNLTGGKGKIDPGTGKAFAINKTPKDIWDGAENGNMWMQVWGLTFGDESWPRRNDKGISIATKTGQLPKPNTQFGNFRVAEAEFYFDKSGPWKDLKDDCMFEMAWRARLRRIDFKNINIVQTVVGSAFDKVLEVTKLKDKLGEWMNTNSGSGGAILGNQLFDPIKDWLNDTFLKPIASLGDKFLAGKIPNWEIIH